MAWHIFWVLYFRFFVLRSWQDVALWLTLLLCIGSMGRREQLHPKICSNAAMLSSVGTTQITFICRWSRRRRCRRHIHIDLCQQANSISFSLPLCLWTQTKTFPAHHSIFIVMLLDDGKTNLFSFICGKSTAQSNGMRWASRLSASSITSPNPLSSLDCLVLKLNTEWKEFDLRIGWNVCVRNQFCLRQNWFLNSSDSDGIWFQLICPVMKQFAMTAMACAWLCGPLNNNVETQNDTGSNW